MVTLSKTRDQEKRGRLKLHLRLKRTTEGVGLKEELLTGLQEMMQKMFELQKVSFEQSIQELKEQISGALDSLVADVDDLKERTKAIEEATVNTTMKTDEHRAAIDALENRMEEMTQRLDDKIDKLESFSKRYNLKFFNVAESTEPENYDSCAKKILDLLQNCVQIVSGSCLILYGLTD